MRIIELDIKSLGLTEAIKSAMKANSVEVLVAPNSSFLPFRCDWIVSDKQIKGLADVVADVDGDTLYFKWI